MDVRARTPAAFRTGVGHLPMDRLVTGSPAALFIYPSFIFTLTP
ncbi:hypothetical protein [Roseiflexus castenholzii]|nr:hypothetical protein [Roseiflexus castenholzii]